jgi:NAD(P)-dependent dehydrogenase (short-subunit alcohol dehydrogenase family)
MRGLDGKRAVVTGAGSGIGRATALRLAAEGARVAAVDIDTETAAATAGMVEEAGGEAIALTCDVADPQQVEASVAEVVAKLGGLEILVNSVAKIFRKPLLDLSIEEWNQTLDVSLNGYFLCIKFAVPEMIRGGAGGKVVSVCSISAHVGYGVPAYTAAKGAILALTRELAGELAGYGINVNSVSPGVIETGINRDTLADASIRQRTIDLTPWGRLGRPDDIAAALTFLASADADYITGADLIVDGAMSSTINWGESGGRILDFHSQR